MRFLPLLALAVGTAWLLFIGFRNIFWTGEKEQNRFERLVEEGRKPEILRDGVAYFVFGLLFLYSALSLSQSIVQQISGGLIILFSTVVILTGAFGDLKNPKQDEAPDVEAVAKRVREKRISGILFVFLGIAWIVVTLPKAI